MSTINIAVIQEQDLFLRSLAPYASVRSRDLQNLLRVEGNSTTIKFVEDLFNSKSIASIEDDAAIVTPISTPPEACATITVVNGRENNDIPAEYSVKGLKLHEFPVIGVYVHRKINPGFLYRVRYNDSPCYMFDGEARCLESVGMGYGKRLTFTGDTLNNNDCYFWSDSHPEGFAFSLVAVQRNEKFIIYNSQIEPVGEAIVESVQDEQREESTEILNGTVCKKVCVTFDCIIKYYQRCHGLLELCQTDFETINGLAVLVKPKRERRSTLKCIENIFLTRFGECSLYKDI